MKISIIGTGYVGLVSGVGFADKGHEVTCVDVVREKVDKINDGVPPIYEEGLEPLLKEAVEKDKLRATTDTQRAVKETNLTFICVGTPSKEDGSIDTSGVEKAAEDLSDSLKKKDTYHTVCVKSTVVPGTTEQKILPILEKSGKNIKEDLGLAMNPEFLREGVALKDFQHPDRIVIGGIDKRSRDVVTEAYKDFKAPILQTNITTAEMIKYASNSLLATKISFANELSRLCERMGIDVYDVMDGVGMDHRINRDFLNAGAGFGGSCFPKDLKALIDHSKRNGLTPKILESVVQVNEEQPIHMVDRLKDEVEDLKDKKVAILGLAFKGGTDDVRETRALPIVKELLKKGAEITAYDPKASENFSGLIDDGIQYKKTVQEALEGADICIIQNDWDEFKDLTTEDLEPMDGDIIVDGRRLLDPKTFEREFKYLGVGKG